MPLIRRGFGGGLPRTLILWDIDDCPVPDGLDTYTVWENLLSAIHDKGYYDGRVEATAFGDLIQTKSHFGGTGVTLFHVSKEKRDERRSAILVKFLCRAIGVGPDTNFVLLLGDITGHMGFNRALNHLKFRTYNHVIVQPNVRSLAELKHIVSAVWLWPNLSARGDPVFQPTGPPLFGHKGKRFKITANTVIFWDVEDCQIPDGLDAAQVCLNIREALANHGTISIDDVVPTYAFGYSRKSLESCDIVHKFFASDDGGDGDGILEIILVDFLCCLIDNPGTENLMLILRDISKHKEIILAANLLQNMGFNVLLSQPRLDSEELRLWPSTKWLWSSLSAGGQPFNQAIALT